MPSHVATAVKHATADYPAPTVELMAATERLLFTRHFPTGAATPVRPVPATLMVSFTALDAFDEALVGWDGAALVFPGPTRYRPVAVSHPGDPYPHVWCQRVAG